MKALVGFTAACLFLFPVVSKAEQSLYVFGATKHFEQDQRNNEGYINLVGYSYKLSYNGFSFDTGINFFMDSYDQPSGSVFSNVSHSKYTYEWFIPMLMIGVVNKGENYYDDSRQTYPFIMPKIRVGKKKGLFLMLSASHLFCNLEMGVSW